MGSRDASIEALLTKAADQVERITSEYAASLHAKKIAPALRVDIKNACENLRSALDYLAADLRQQFCPNAARENFYFPILPDPATFDAKLDKWFPGLRESVPQLASELELLQPYHQDQEWLGQFNRVNRENKHGDLVEQTRVATSETTVSGSTGKVSWRPDSVIFGPGVSILGAPIDPRTQLPQKGSQVQVKQVVWVDFQFRGLGVSALWLLRTALDEHDGRIQEDTIRIRLADLDAPELYGERACKEGEWARDYTYS